MFVGLFVSFGFLVLGLGIMSKLFFWFPVSRIGHGVIWIYQVHILYVLHIQFKMNYVLLAQLQFAFYVCPKRGVRPKYVYNIYIYIYFFFWRHALHLSKCSFTYSRTSGFLFKPKSRTLYNPNCYSFMWFLRYWQSIYIYIYM